MSASRVSILTGAPGSGKTAIADIVPELLPTFNVLDMDALLAPAGELAGMDLRRSEAAHLWRAYNDLWLVLAARLARLRPVLLLGPVLPGEVEVSPSRSLLPAIDWAVLDCSDETRRERLGERGYGAAAIDDAVADAAAARTLGLHIISTEGVSPDQSAADVAKWATRSRATRD